MNRKLLSLAIGAVLLQPIELSKQALASEAIVEKFEFHIPAQRADKALTSLAQQAGVTLIFNLEKVWLRRANPVKGVYSLPEALEILLRGSGLEGSVETDTRIVIREQKHSDIDHKIGGRPVKAVSKAGIFSSLVTLLAGMPSALAQPVTAADKVELEEIVVTARKRQESLISVPVAVTALSAADLAARGAIDPITDVAAYTPGFAYQNQSVNRNDRGFRTFVMRGMVPGSPTSLRQSVTIFVDGTPVVGGNVEGVTNIERVEVVKGPQSAYFGRATFAGAINYVTADPGVDWTSEVGVNRGSYGLSDLTIKTEGALIGDWLTVRASARAFHTDGGYANNEIPGDRLGRRNTTSASVTLLAKPSDQLKMKLFANLWEDADGPPTNAQFNRDYWNCNAGAAATGTLNYICGALGRTPSETQVQNTVLTPSAIQVLTGAIGPGYTNFTPSFLDSFGLRRKAYQVHGSVEYRFANDMSLSVNAAIDQNKWAFLTDTTFRDTRAIPNPNFGTIANVVPYWSRSAYGTNLDDNQTIEARLSSAPSSPLSWMVGVNYFHAQADQLTNAFTPAGFIAATPINRNKIDTFGVFGSIGYEISEQLSVSAEARSQSDKLFQLSASGTNRVDNPANITAKKTFHSVTPRLIVQYRPTSDVSAYVSYAEGTRPGAFNTVYYTLAPDIKAQVDAVTPIAAAVPEEEIRMYEAGLKGVFLDNRLRLLSAVYQGDWTNRHIPSIINTFRNGVLFQQLQLIQPGGAVDLKGLELEAAFQVSRQLTIEGSFSVSDSKIKKTFCSDCRLITGLANPVGTQLPSYPKTKGSVSLAYTQPITGKWDGFARVDYLYTSKIFDTEANVAWTSPTSKANLRIGATRDGYLVELYGTNIFDNRTPTNLARNTDSYTGTNAISVSLPDRATFGIRVSAKL
jgi:iron complex outermembrane receptor protein